MNLRPALAALLALLLTPQLALAGGDRVRVVTTIPCLADMAREIGGDRVKVHSIARGPENLHSLPTRPSALVQMNKADLFLQIGLGLEHAFAPGLLRAARNGRIQPTTDGYKNCAEGWTAIQVPKTLSRAQGVDIHPAGNPHFYLSVRAGEHLADRVLEALVRRDPAGEALFRANHARYVQRVRAARERWKPLAERLRGKKVVQFHFEFDYLLQDLGIEMCGTVEPKPGVMPSPREVAKLAARMKEEGVDTIVTAPWSNNRFVRSLAKHSGATILELPHMVGAVDGVDTWIELQDELLRRLVARLAPLAETATAGASR